MALRARFPKPFGTSEEKGENMKRNSGALFVLLLLALSSQAFSGSLRIAASLDYYSIQDSIYKDVYGSSNLMFGGSLSYEAIKKLEVRAEANYFLDKGRMTATKEELKFRLVPIVLGVRFRVLDRKLSPYLGAGIGSYSYKEYYPERLGNASDSTAGYHLEAGCYYNLVSRFFMDFNMRYIKADAKAFDKTARLGGFRIGIGVGYRLF
jgi:opacity protein-like surface antigen